MPTIADVAKLAGVSTGTVSRVINGANNVTPETRTKVDQAIAALAYEPNAQARSLRSKRTDTIALALPELSNYFWTTVARGVQDATQAMGYHVLICNTNGKPSNYLRYLEQMVNRVDGMILSRRSERTVVSSHGQPTKPLVFVGQSQAAHWDVDNVYSDSISGAFALTQHLIRLGHRQIAIVTGRESSASATDRVAGYCMALADAELLLDARRICWGEYERKTAEHLTHELMDRLPDTTGIVAANNEIAIGVIQALEKRGLMVPQDVAVVCFDDFYPDSRFATMMTVASQSPYDLGLNAAQLLLSRLNSSDYLRAQTVVLPVRLIVRQSCGGTPSESEPDTSFDNVHGQIIQSLSRQRIQTLAAAVRSVLPIALPPNDIHLFQANQTQLKLLRRVLRCETVDPFPIPHFEYAITSRALYRYVLEREPELEPYGSAALVTPEDQIEFAQRSGLAAIPCRYPYQPALAAQPSDGVLPPFDFPLLTDQLDFFDRYVRAARNTNVGIAADFRSIVGDTLRIHEALAAVSPDAPGLEAIAAVLLDYQMKVVQLICDRFAGDMAFVLFSDDLADANGLRLPLDLFQSAFAERLRRLIHPAKEHGLATVLYSPGSLETVIPVIHELGFGGVYVGEGNELTALQQQTTGRVCLMGGIPAAALNGSPEAVQAWIAQLGDVQGLIVGAAGEVDDDVSIGSFFSLVSALSSPRT